MDYYEKIKTAHQARILQAGFPPGLGLSWHLADSSDLSISGLISSSTSSKHSLALHNQFTSIKLSAYSQKQFKAHIKLLVQQTNLIIPKLAFKADYLTNTFSNHFLMTYLDKPHQASIGIQNSRLSLFYAYKTLKNCGVAIEISGLHDFSDALVKGAFWMKFERCRLFLKGAYKGIFEGSMLYRTRAENQIAAKIIASDNDVQILLGVLYRVTQRQRVRLRLDSEGKIGVQLCDKINDWLEICAHSDISVKQLAKDHQTFLGFGIRFDLLYKTQST